MLKRSFDIVASLTALLILSPVFLVISLWVWFDTRSGVFFEQGRIGRNGKPFRLFKFRTMVDKADQKGRITVGDRDNRITRSGYYLRKYKLDELPQLINVLTGKMSIVGPRPEVREYVELYSENQLEVLAVRPGLTDYASLKYAHESELLAEQQDPEAYYRNVLMPEKVALGIRYVRERSFGKDLSLIFQTIAKIIR